MKINNCKTLRVSTDKYQYYIIYDYAAGKKNRYLTLVMSECEPVVIGRELTLAESKKVIEKFDMSHKPSWDL